MKEKLLSALQQKPYFLVLLPLSFIAHGYNEFFGFFSLKFLSLNLAIILLCTAIIFLLSFLAFKNKRKAALFSFWILLFILVFGAIHDKLKALFGAGFFSSYKFILSVSLLLILTFLRYLKKTDAVFQKAFLFLNLLLSVFVLYEAFDSSMNLQQFRKSRNLIDNRFDVLKNYKPDKNLPDSLKPDIYFIVFDAMPSSYSMSEINPVYDSSLSRFLQQKRFYIASNSSSNYNQTVFSISSTFNMDYIPSGLAKYNQKNYLYALQSISDNSLFEILQAQDYTIYQYQPLTFNNKFWSRHIVFDKMINSYFLNQSLPGRLFKDLSWHLGKISYFRNQNNFREERECRRSVDDFLYTVSKVKESCHFTGKAKFVYTHIMVPHEPYLFNHNGDIICNQKTTRENEMTKFYEQTLYSETVIQDIINYILKFNKRKAVLLIQGDHGFRSMFGNAPQLMFKNLTTVYFPDNDYQTLYTTQSPVNSFRLILNKYFSANLPLLKDSSIFIPYTLPGEK